MTPEELEEGYAMAYKKLFSHAAIWKRKPHGMSAIFPYMAMAYLYKRSNLLWHLLIKYQLTAKVWHPLVEATRLRHLRFRKKLSRLS